MNFDKAVFALKAELISAHPETGEKSNDDGDEGDGDGDGGSKRRKIVQKIERITRRIIESVSRGESPVLETINHTDLTNCCFDGRLKLDGAKKKTKKIHFSRSNGRSKFVTIVFLLSKIHKLLTTCKTCTRRELYYKNLRLFRSQKQVDDSMRDVSFILEAPAWELGVLATSKGIVSGPLLLHLRDGAFVNCSKKGGVLIPPNVSDVTHLSSSAVWVLIVEKDASFQRLIDGEAASRLGPCIVVTVSGIKLACSCQGKGFPDVSTRMLVCKFWEHLQIPILALSDADPYGFEIMCVYRFGSVSMSSHATSLACPAVRWLGVHPSDIKPLLLDSKALSARDVKKIRSLMERSYVKENDQLKNQLEIFLKENVKAEIEGLSNISTNYLIDTYVRNKIRCLEYI